MLARCISNDLGSCQVNRELAKLLGLNTRLTTKTPLVLGADYLVIAFSFGPFVPWLFVADRFGLQYPLIYPCFLFSIVDTRPSSSWAHGLWTDSQGSQSVWLAPQQFVEDPLLPGKALEGERAALATYAEMVASLSLEFALPWITNHAEALGDDLWVSDSDFVESWRADPSMEMTKRPSTGELFHRPKRQ
jgi:hypothetical protein